MHMHIQGKKPGNKKDAGSAIRGSKLSPGGLQACGPVVAVSDAKMTKNEHIVYDPSCGVTFDPGCGVIHTVLIFAHFCIRGVNSRSEGRREGQPLSPSLPPWLGSFLGKYTSETSTSGEYFFWLTVPPW